MADHGKPPPAPPPGGPGTGSAWPEPPAPATDEGAQDRRLVRMMLAMSPTQRLQTLTNWWPLVAAGRVRRRSTDGKPAA